VSKKFRPPKSAINNTKKGLEFPTKEAVMEEVEFWLYENHPDFCPNGFRGDEEE